MTVANESRAAAPLVQLRHLARILNGGTPPSGEAENWDGDVPFVTPLDLNGADGKLIHTTGRTLTEQGAKHSGSAPSGSVILSTRAPIGYVGRLAWCAAFNQGCRALAPNVTVSGRFLAYCLIAAREELSARGQGTTFLELSATALASVRLPRPPLGQQRAIADYLDHETAQVDAFIATSERLIHLLTERRSAVISRAITKGMDPTAPLKPSGVPWLGDIPAHWESNQVKHVGRAIIGLTYSPEEVVGSADEGTLVLRAGNIQQGRIVFEDSVYVSTPVPDRLRLREGDIVICARNGSAHLVGKNSVATSEVVGQTWGAFMAVLRSDINDFLRWVLNSPIFSASTGQFATTTINQLTSSTLHGLRFARPPESERRAISEFLDRAISDIDRAVSTAQRGIALARERRAAVISAAVTGKLDVRVAT